jgi:hypothetical protein
MYEGAVGLVVEEVRVLVDVERDERRRVPHGNVFCASPM